MTQPQATELLSDAELLPCPFCGNEVQAGWGRINPKARCVTEGCKGGQLPVINLDVPDDIAAWNTRAHLSSKREGEADTYLMVGRSDDNFKTLTPPGLKKGIPVYAKATFAPGVITQPSTKQDSIVKDIAYRNRHNGAVVYVGDKHAIANAPDEWEKVLIVPLPPEG